MFCWTYDKQTLKSNVIAQPKHRCTYLNKFCKKISKTIVTQSITEWNLMIFFQTHNSFRRTNQTLHDVTIKQSESEVWQKQRNGRVTLHKKQSFSIKCDQIHSFLRIWSHLLKKSLMANFIFLCNVTTSKFKVLLKSAIKCREESSSEYPADLIAQIMEYT